MLIQKLLFMNGKKCVCGKEHTFDREMILGRDALEKLPEMVRKLRGSKVYVLADPNTYSVAGERVMALLKAGNIAHTCYVFPQEMPEPDEKNVGSALMHMGVDCDLIVGVGSGVINDISKILAAHRNLPFIIVATAPSMDGYASMSSSVTLDGIKVSLPSRCADIIIGDIDILKSAPKEMLLSGIGDMLAKYVSILEWRLSSLINEEYYCENIANLIHEAVAKTRASAAAALAGDENAIMEVFHALLVGSVAMNYAGVSRPASGAEHYISHLYDTRGVEFGEKTAFHGIQCAIATLYVMRQYQKLLATTPSEAAALRYVSTFDKDMWNEKLKELLGASAYPLIMLEKKEGKHDKEKHRKRLCCILERWEDITLTIREEIVSVQELEDFMKSIGMPTTFGEVGMREDLLKDLFKVCGDIRDKYVLPRLLWDLGLLDTLV